MQPQDQAGDDRRRDLRHTIPGTEIKVRKHSFTGLGGGYETSLAVDFSDNGLSFISASLKLKLLDKVDFVLSLNGRDIDGCAIICHRSRTDIGQRYGLLFIATSSDVTHLVDPKVFANLEINMHAEQTAEYVAQMIGHSDKALNHSRQWHLLVNAVDVFVRRISEIVREKSQTKAEYQRTIQAIEQFITVDRDAHRVSFRYLNLAGDVETVDISVHNSVTRDSVEYQIGELKSTASVQEVIDIIGRAFIDQYRTGFA